MMKRKLDDILLIDDDMTVNFMHGVIIENEKVTNSFHVTETAEDALKFLSSNKPDLILLDLNLPKTDGWEFLERYKKMLPAADRSRIIVLSSSANPDDKKRAEASPGIAGFYNKPLTKEVLLEIYEDTLKSISKNNSAD
ncbi:response regulator [soil metagenome]